MVDFSPPKIIIHYDFHSVMSVKKSGFPWSPVIRKIIEAMFQNHFYLLVYAVINYYKPHF
jgi:hypothetical protein